MLHSFLNLRSLFCFTFALAALSVLALNGYALAVVAVLAVWILLRYQPLPSFNTILLIGGFLLRVILIIPIRPPIQSDFLLIFQAAQNLLAGDLSFNSSTYFSLWAYQSPFVAWEAFWLNLWNDPRCLQLLNAALASATVWLLYRLARSWVDERAAQASALLLTAFPFALSLHTILSNQIPSAFFLTLGLWFLASNDCRKLRFYRFPLAGLALQFGNLLRNEGIILLCAILAWAVLDALRNPHHAKLLATGLLSLLLVYSATFFAADALVRSSGLNPAGISNLNPAWKFVTGLNYDTSGSYSQSDWDTISATLDQNHHPTPETIALQRNLISQRLSVGPTQLLRLAVKKIQLLWCSDALDWTLGASSHSTGFLAHKSAYELARQFDRGLFFLSLAFAAFGLFPQKSWSLRPTSAYLPYLVFFAAFSAFLLIEVQPRYAFLPQLFLFSASAFGLQRLDSFWLLAHNSSPLPLPIPPKKEFPDPHEHLHQPH